MGITAWRGTGTPAWRRSGGWRTKIGCLTHGRSPTRTAGGIDTFTGQVLAAGFAKYGVDVRQQRDLWHCVLKHAMLNFQSAKRFIDRIGGRLGEKSEDGLLFALPANATVVLAEARA